MPPLRILPVSLAALLLATGLAGCGPDSDINSPPSPVLASSPGPVRSTPTPTPTKEAPYGEAERVVRRAQEVEDSYLLLGGYTTYPPELYELLAGDYLSLSQDSFETMKTLGWRGVPGTHPILLVQPAPNHRKNASEVAVRVCLDSREAPLVDEAGVVMSQGRLAVIVYYFKHFDGKLKLFLADPATEVEACPFG